MFGTYKYRSTLNRRYNKLLKMGLTNKYMNNNPINNLYIDSTDVMNYNCSKKYTYKSFKLHKQAVRLSIICDDNRIPLTHKVDKAQKNDSVLGFELAHKFKVPDKKIHYLVADKGYIMKDYNKIKLLKNNKLKIITPKKKYKKKKKYKTKNYKPKIKRIRHSIQIKAALKKRIIVEHCNSILHRSFKRLSKIYDRSIYTYNGFVMLATICMIINYEYK